MAKSKIVKMDKKNKETFVEFYRRKYQELTADGWPAHTAKMIINHYLSDNFHKNSNEIQEIFQKATNLK